MNPVERVYVDIEPHALTSCFDREPFGFTHNLSSLDVFRFSNLQHLTSLYTDRDYFVASAAPAEGTEFYAVTHRVCRPDEAMDRLGSGNQQILLKHPERYDRRFRDLLGTLFADIARRRGGLSGKLVRLDSSLLISSSATITPFHYDPAISFFFQIAGEKDYHIYSPAVLSEPELEAFYGAGITTIAQVPLAGRDPALEHVFRLGPGKGMHQPRNAPHWVQTHDSIAVSYVVSFETDVTRALAHTRAFNHYARAAGVVPGPVGCDRGADTLKADVMRAALPVRRSVESTLRRVAQRLRR